MERSNQAGGSPHPDLDGSHPDGNETPFRTLVEAGADAVLVVAQGGTILYANPAAGALMGRCHAALHGQSFGVPVVTGETTEVDLRRADGAVRVAEMCAVEIIWNAEPAYLASLRDVTDRRCAEEAARESAATLKSFFDSASMMMGVAELVGDDIRLVSVNAATARFLGGLADSLAGTTARQWGVPREIVARWVDGYRESERTSIPVRFEYERNTSDGTRWLATTIGIIGQGPAAPFSFVTEDVTEIKRVQAELAEANRRKDEFLAMLAHELRNPLAPIRNAVEILRGDFQGANAGRSVLDMMDRQIQHMVCLLDDLLDVSRVTHGTIRLKKEPLNITAVVMRAVETSKPHLEVRGHTFTTELEPGPHLVEGDLARLVQVVSNLLNNAAKYTPDGGRVVLSVRREGHQIAIRVRDNGTGIQPALLPFLFETFAQGTRTLARSEGGLGLGLALVKSLTELHGGTVWGSSAGPGLGSEFEVGLPLVIENPHSIADAEREKEPVGGSPLRILVVDDNRDAADSLALLLELAGHGIEVCYDGPTALTLARQGRPDVVLLDLGLPGMDGYEVAQSLRCSTDTAGARIIAVSGYGQEEDRERAKKAGFDNHLVKPVAHDLLMKCLARGHGVSSR